MPRCPIDSIDDPRVGLYRNLKDRDLAREPGELFIAEGQHLVRRLLASGFVTHSVLLAARRAEEIVPLVPADVPVYVVPEEMVHQIVGFEFHSGVMAIAQRPANPNLDQILEHAGEPATLVVCPEVINTENLGSLMRISAAFGATAMLVGERSCDPFWRRAVRVSMGAVFTLPIVRSDDLLRDLEHLRRRWQVELVATVLDEEAQPLEEARRPGAEGKPDRVALLLGSEAQGLHRRWLAVCDRRVTIPMELGTDSLNVAVAAGVFLYHFTRKERRKERHEGI